MKATEFTLTYHPGSDAAQEAARIARELLTTWISPGADMTRLNSAATAAMNYLCAGVEFDESHAVMLERIGYLLGALAKAGAMFGTVAVLALSDDDNAPAEMWQHLAENMEREGITY